MKRKALSMVGALLAGDAAAFLLDTRGQIEVWSSSRAPRWYRRMMRFFEKRTALCRVIAAGELALAFGLLRRASRPSG